uniref:Uncharacterized protein MANES_06G068100 n=1 Tax=Rhizophora mucronata TaxID=61149 RepID=A0A2P2JZF9_RHIMU
MGNQEIMQISAAVDTHASMCNGAILQLRDNFEEKENGGVDDLLIGLDSYLEDINNHLIISRMVSESVMKGMISAVEQETTEKISEKEKELARLEEMLHLFHVVADEKEQVRHSLPSHQPKGGKCEQCPSYADILIEHDKLEKSLGDLGIAAKKLVKKVKIEIDKIKGSFSMRRIGSNSELVGLSGLLQEKASDKWVDVDRMLDALRTSLDFVQSQASNIVHLSKSVLCNWQQDREFQAEIEEMVMKNCFRSLQEQFEQRIWDQNASPSGNESANWLEKIKEISSLCQELDTISKSLSAPDSGQLTSHSSLEHRRVSGNHLSSTTLPLEGNDKLDESIPSPENFDLARLNHLSREDLATHFKGEMIEMKRHHELKLHEITEAYFTLKREYLKERDSLPVKKDKEFDLLRKKIPEVILKLDVILVENEKVPAVGNNLETLHNMKNRLDILLSENLQLRDLVTDRKKEIKCLSSHVSDAAEKISTHALAEASLSKRIMNLQSVIQDAHIEESICEGLFSLLLKELVGQIKCFCQEANMEFDVSHGTHEILFRKVAQTLEPSSKVEIADSDMESVAMQGLCEVIFKEALKQAMEEITNLNLKFINEKEVRSSLEMEKLEKEKAFILNMAEKKELEQELLLLKVKVDEKDKVLHETANALTKEKEKFNLTSQELDSLRNQASQQQVLIMQRNEEVKVVKGNLTEALDKIKLYEEEICKYREELGLVTKRLLVADEEKCKLLAVAQETQDALSLMEESARQHRRQMDSIISLIHELSTAFFDFEGRALEDIWGKNLRLKNLSCQVSSLAGKANKLRRTGLLYKQRLERKCCDLQKAEAEVCCNFYIFWGCSDIWILMSCGLSIVLKCLLDEFDAIVGFDILGAIY